MVAPGLQLIVLVLYLEREAWRLLPIWLPGEYVSRVGVVVAAYSDRFQMEIIIQVFQQQRVNREIHVNSGGKNVKTIVRVEYPDDVEIGHDRFIAGQSVNVPDGWLV